MRASDDASKLLIADEYGHLAMVEVLPDDGSPFKLLWSKKVREGWFRLGSATFSWDGDPVAISDVGDYSDVSTYVFDSETGAALYKLEDTVFNDARLRFSSDDKHLLVWGYTKYVKVEARSGKIVYSGDFAPTPTRLFESRQSVFEVGVRPHPAYEDVWVFRDGSGKTMVFDERRKRPVWLEPEHRDDRHLGRWWLHVSDELDEVTNSDGASFAIGSFADELTERNRFFYFDIRSTGESISVRSKDKKAISVYSVFDDKKIATVAAKSQVWSQSYELLSSNCVINLGEGYFSGNNTLTFYALDGTGIQLTLEALTDWGEGITSLIAHTPDGAYAVYGNDAESLVESRVVGTAKHDPKAVRAVLARLLNRKT